MAELDMSKVDEQVREDNEIEARAKEIFESGKALEFMINSCLKLHPGDRDKRIITAGLLSFAATKCMNSFGIHLYVAGTSGSGKSHVISTLLKHIPKDKQLSGHFSDKALFYTEIQEGTVLAMDDQELSETANDIMKAQTSAWNEPYLLHTVIDKKGITMCIPPRCPRWVAKCDATGDEQTADRQITMFADDSVEQKKTVRDRTAYIVSHPTEYADDTEQRICQKIWDLIPPVYVKIPYADKVRLSGDDSNRNVHMVYSLIMSSCVMAAPKRDIDDGCLIATEEDFAAAAKIMNPILAGDGGSQKLKLSPKQQVVLNFLKGHPTGLYPYQEILNAIAGKNIAQAHLSQAMNGRKPDHSDGLVKIPGISICIDTYGTRKNERCIDWEKDVFEQWVGSEAYVTLEE